MNRPGSWASAPVPDTEAAEPAAQLAWSALYDQLESCCDACEHVADIVETVVMKNS